MNYSFDDYESAMNSLREEIYALRDEALMKEFTEGMKDADEEYLGNARNAYVTYRQKTNPYGKDFEKITSAGLGSSGKEREVFGNNFTEYQSRMGSMRKDREDITKNLIEELLSGQSENDEKRINDAVDMAEKKMEEYWKEYSWQYKLMRDELEDKRYEEELKKKYSI